MAKGDHNRSENKIDEQQTQSQGYLTGIQGNLGNQYGRNDALYWGSGAPTFGTINNYGSTTPNYDPYGGKGQFPGNQSGSSMPNSPYNMSGGGSSSFNPSTDYQGEFQSAISKLGIAPTQFRGNPQVMDSVTNYLNQQYPGQGWTNGGARAGDWVGVGGGVNGFDVLPAGDRNWQFNYDPAIPGGGGGGGFGSYGSGGIPGMAMGDYSTLGNLYLGMLPQYQQLYGDLRGQYGSAIGSASNMANTGGLSDADKANIRARAISPIRSVYSQGVQDLNRQRALQGGYSPGFSTALGRFTRQQGQQTSDATTNAEAAIAQLVQQGKLGGLSAWSSMLGSEGPALLGSLGGQVNALGGASGLYASQPGMARFFGDQMNTQTGQQLQAAGLQNQLSNSIMQNENYLGANVAGNTQGTLQNLLLGAKGAGALGGAIAPWVGSGPGGVSAMNGGFVADPNEIYGGQPPGSPYANYNMPSDGGGYNWAPAQGTYYEGGQYGLGTVPNYGPPPMDYGPNVIDQYDNPWA